MIHRIPLRVLLPLALLAALPCAAAAQFGNVPSPEELVEARAPKVTVRAGATAEVTVTLKVLDTWHINANPAANEDMIATAVALDAGPGISVKAAAYPPPKIAKLAFDDEPMLVWDGETTIRIPVAVAPNAPNGERTLTGTVMFQACNDNVCLAPARVPFEVVVAVEGGAAAPAVDGGPGSGADSTLAAPPPADTAAALPAGAFTTAPPPGAAAPSAAGGWLHYLAVFVLGLGLNLTPCVYPMLGVTVSIFGARRAAPPAQVFAMALLYVLGMALMYTVLGVSAALTGGLFGSFLQNPVVLIGIGALMIALALSMFGLYEIQPPAALLTKLGGSSATSAAGVFFSGLVVGIFAAPCIGPPIVGLLALVGARADPWFGFTTFFTLAMGLGLPYLILGTFSNLLQTLPRSGEWMVWVKKLFGVVLVGVGLFYAMLALAPGWATAVIPATLLAGGLYLGFVEKSASSRPAFAWFKRLAGTAAVIAAVVIFAAQSREGVTFQEASAASLDAALASGRPVMVDFSADWCVPCHELDDVTFTDRRVKDAARDFHAFKVNLTRYDSPEAEQWRKRYDIRGVPTVVFLAAGGVEVREARVEGFLPPERFLERMRLASERVKVAESRAAR